MSKENIRLEEIYKHFQDTLGRVPEPMRTLGENAPDVLNGYYWMRRWLQREPPEGALPRKFKELLFVAMDPLVGAPLEYGKAHVASAIKAGATKEEVVEVVVLLVMLAGMPKILSWGHELIKAAEEAEKNA